MIFLWNEAEAIGRRVRVDRFSTEGHLPIMQIYSTSVMFCLVSVQRRRKNSISILNLMGKSEVKYDTITVLL